MSVPPDHDLTVAEFQQLARSAIADIHDRGRLPLLVGGSGLYFRAVVDDLTFPPRSPDVRAAPRGGRAGAGGRGTPRRACPSSIRRPPPGSSPSNARRTIRALEVIELTGRPFSDNDSWDRYESIYELKVAGIDRPRPELFARIEERVDEMLAAGPRRRSEGARTRLEPDRAPGARLPPGPRDARCRHRRASSRDRPGNEALRPAPRLVVPGRPEGHLVRRHAGRYRDHGCEPPGAWRYRRDMRFAKYHGIGNDFVMIADPDDRLTLSADARAATLRPALRDRRRRRHPGRARSRMATTSSWTT